MRVTFIVSSASLGGAELYALRLLEALQPHVSVRLMGTADAPLVEQARRSGIEFTSLSLGPKLSRATFVRQLARVGCHRRRLHEAVTESCRDGWCILQFKWEEILWGGEVEGDRVALLEHGPIPSPLLANAWTRRRLRSSFQRAAVVFAASEPASASIRALAGREPLPLRAGVAASRRAAALRKAPDLRSKLAPDASILLAYAGRVEPDKGVFGLVDVVAAIPDAHAVIVGSGSALPAVEAAAMAKGVRDRIVFPGYVADVLPFLAAADATILLSTESGEGRPLVALESLAVGTPVVGLAATPALRALAAEFGAEAVALIDAPTPDEVTEALGRSATRPPIPLIPTWDDVAEQLLAALAASERRQSRAA